MRVGRVMGMGGGVEEEVGWGDGVEDGRGEFRKATIIHPYVLVHRYMRSYTDINA